MLRIGSTEPCIRIPGIDAFPVCWALPRLSGVTEMEFWICNNRENHKPFNSRRTLCPKHSRAKECGSSAKVSQMGRESSHPLTRTKSQKMEQTIQEW